MRIKLENPSPVPSHRWISGTAPAIELIDRHEGEILIAGQWRVIVGKAVGRLRYWHARREPGSGPFPSAGVFEAKLEETGRAEETRPFRGGGTLTLEVRTDRVDVSHTFELGAAPVDYQDRILQVRKAVALLGPAWTVELWCYEWVEQEIREFELLIVHSSPEVSHLKERILRIALRSDDPLWIDDGALRGARPATPHDWILAEDCSIFDGQALAFYGRVAVLPTWPGWLLAGGVLGELPYRLVGMVDAWKGNWGPFGHDWPEFSAEELARIEDYVVGLCRAHASRLLGATQALQDGGKISPWAEVPFSPRRPADSGDQNAFGVAKLGQALIPFEPLFLIPARYSATYGMACRPVHHREACGAHLSRGIHPDLILLSERPHWHTGVSPDRLGKPDGPLEAEGWEGLEDQHFSPLLEVGTYLLTGSRMLLSLVEEIVERAEFEYTLPSERTASTNDMRAARAVGRVGLSLLWINWAMTNYSTGPGPNFTAAGRLVAARQEECIARQWSGRQVQEGLVRPLRWETHEHFPWRPKADGWRPPFEAIGVAGLVAAHRLCVAGALGIARSVALSMLTYGLKDDLEPWWGIRWDQTRPGAPPGEGDYQDGVGAWGLWSFGPLLLLNRYLVLERGDHSLEAKILAFAAAAVRRYRGDEPETWIRRAEWGGRVESPANPDRPPSPTV
jgi:hypothetical protein